jgi:hypothetical protein
MKVRSFIVIDLDCSGTAGGDTNLDKRTPDGAGKMSSDETSGSETKDKDCLAWETNC